MASVMIRAEVPPTNNLVALAPRAEGKGAFAGEYGYAVAITGDGLIRVHWDDSGWDDMQPQDVILDWRG